MTPLLGIALGQPHTPSALALLMSERHDDTRRSGWQHTVRDLERFARTSLKDLIARLRLLCAELTGVSTRQELEEAWERDHPGQWRFFGRKDPIPPPVRLPGERAEPPILLVDETEVGQAGLEMIHAARLPVKLYAITVSVGGDVVPRAGGWSVPMRDLVGRLQMAVDEPRIIISKDLQEAKRMMRELANFRSTIATTAGNDSLDTWRSQGALCLATSLCVWFAERKIRNLVF